MAMDRRAQRAWSAPALTGELTGPAVELRWTGTGHVDSLLESLGHLTEGVYVTADTGGESPVTVPPGSVRPRDRGHHPLLPFPHNSLKAAGDRSDIA